MRRMMGVGRLVRLLPLKQLQAGSIPALPATLCSSTVEQRFHTALAGCSNQPAGTNPARAGAARARERVEPVGRYIR